MEICQELIPIVVVAVAAIFRKSCTDLSESDLCYINNTAIYDFLVYLPSYQAQQALKSILIESRPGRASYR